MFHLGSMLGVLFCAPPCFTITISIPTLHYSIWQHLLQIHTALTCNTHFRRLVSLLVFGGLRRLS